MPSVVELLQQAISNGEVVTIIYNGGSRPGQPRSLIPLSLTNEDLVAREPAARITKSFKLQKIASASLSNGEALDNPNAIPIAPPQAPSFSTLAEYSAYLSSDFRAAGWNVIEGENYLAVGTYFKTGKPKKTPSVSIQFIDRSIEELLDWETGEISTQSRELTGRERPWRVSSWRQPQGKSFAQLQNAAEMFIQEVRASNPSTASTLRQ